ncbi:hypothetical protein LJK88_05590 [Paenibacillus sp. P26]|nr:hypothetical protein LJK88_05590 [Paenibacillus sp. P26]
MKKTYFVSVGSGTLEDRQMMADEANHEYEFKIEATDEEIKEVQRPLDMQKADEHKSFARTPIPYKSADHDEAMDTYNDLMLRLYTAIYRLGTPEAKRHIEKMRILDKLHHSDYSDPGYKRR